MAKDKGTQRCFELCHLSRTHSIIIIIYYLLFNFIIIPISDCADAYGNDLIPEMMICAGEDGKDSCQVIVTHTLKVSIEICCPQIVCFRTME